LEPRDVQSVEDLTRLPRLGKPEIERKMASWAAAAPRATINSTSGSSGRNFRFLQDGAMRSANSAAVHWAYGIAGADYWGDRRLVIWGHSPGLGWRSELSERLKVWALNARTLQAYGLDARRCTHYMQIINDWRPTVLEGYPSYLHELARQARHDRWRPARSPRAIITSGEQLTREQRQDIEEVFGTRISNRYGSREFGIIAQAAAGDDALLVPPTRFLIETDTDGELLITDLQNRATPFIRYACGDLGRVASRQQFGAAQVIADLAGRRHDRLETPRGRLIPGQYWTLLSRSVPGIEEFQVRQTPDGRIELLVSAEAKLSEGDAKDLQNRVLQEYPELPGFAVVRVAAFIRTPLGKRKFVIRDGGDDT
jgi:phenylacetate-CoA ligase